MSDQKQYLTEQGLKSLEEKYNNLRQKISEKANSEDKLFMLRQEAEKIKKILKNAKIIEESARTEEVTIGSVVKAKQGDQIDEFQIVESIEANPMEGKISKESMVGQSLMGHKKGEKVTIQSHIKIEYEIIDIQ